MSPSGSMPAPALLAPGLAATRRRAVVGAPLGARLGTALRAASERGAACVQRGCPGSSYVRGRAVGLSGAPAARPGLAGLGRSARRGGCRPSGRDDGCAVSADDSATVDRSPSNQGIGWPISASMAPRERVSSGATSVKAVPRPAGAAGAADPVDVILGMMRHVEIEDVADRRDVEAAGRDVAGDQQGGLAVAEGIQGRGARPLVHVAVEGGRVEAVADQRLLQQGDVALAVAEDDAVLEFRLAADQVAQALALGMPLGAGGDQALRDRRGRGGGPGDLDPLRDCAGTCRPAARSPAAWSRRRTGSAG